MLINRTMPGVAGLNTGSCRFFYSPSNYGGGNSSAVRNSVRSGTPQVLDRAYRDGRRDLYEHETYKIFSDQLGISCPEHMFVPFEGSDEPRAAIENKLVKALSLNSEEVVMKIVASGIAHKSKHEAGPGVLVGDKDISFLSSGYLTLKQRFGGPQFGSLGVLVCERVPFTAQKEYLVGLNYDEQFARHVLAFGSGGTATEHVRDTAFRTMPESGYLSPAEIECMIKETSIGKKAGGNELTELVRVLGAVQRLASISGDHIVRELDINPVVLDLRTGAACALDGVLKFDRSEITLSCAEEIPTRDLSTLLKPAQAAVFGGGRTAESIADQMRGNGAGILVERVQSGSGLPADTDLAVICSTREKVVPILERIIRQKSGESKKEISVVVIAGGFDESETGQQFAGGLDSAIRTAREQNVGLNILGPNSLGIWTGKGGYSALFADVNIPPSESGNSAIISQSGGYIVGQIGLNPGKNWGLVMSIGNGRDLGVGALLQATLDLRPEIKDIDIYLEGLKPGEGAFLCKLCDRAKKAGKKVGIYLTADNKVAKDSAASHTASMLPKRAIAVSLLKASGAVISTLRADEPCDYQSLASQVRWNGPVSSIAVLANSGIESVTAVEAEGADHFIKPFSGVLREKLQQIVPQIGTLRNPLDITGAGDSSAFINAAKAMLDCDDVDALAVSVVFQSPGISRVGQETEIREGSLAYELAAMIKRSRKPVVLAVPVSRQACPAVFEFLDKNGIVYVPYAAQAVRLLAMNHSGI